MKKVIKQGFTYILVSKGYGAGWSTWNSEHPNCLFDPKVVQLVLDRNNGGIEEQEFTALVEHHCAEEYGASFYSGAAKDLEVELVTVGQRFYIDAYDGNETVILETDMKWITA